MRRRISQESRESIPAASLLLYDVLFQALEYHCCDVEDSFAHDVWRSGAGDGDAFLMFDGRVHSGHLDLVCPAENHVCVMLMPNSVYSPPCRRRLCR